MYQLITVGHLDSGSVLQVDLSGNGLLVDLLTEKEARKFLAGRSYNKAWSGTSNGRQAKPRAGVSDDYCLCVSTKSGNMDNFSYSVSRIR